jgi:hypothetical protein
MISDGKSQANLKPQMEYILGIGQKLPLTFITHYILQTRNIRFG